MSEPLPVHILERQLATCLNYRTAYRSRPAAHDPLICRMRSDNEAEILGLSERLADAGHIWGCECGASGPVDCSCDFRDDGRCDRCGDTYRSDALSYCGIQGATFCAECRGHECATCTPEAQADWFKRCSS